MKIGDFSKLSRISVKTLRFYDEMDLLKPVQIDPYTGYRYYAVVSWIENNGYHITGPCREIYLRYERGGDQKDYVTEVQFPVSKG